ncbi:MAG: tRNA (adenosine(37)-N6)-threonylcarbamoyltransferase complex dimerization subunit type 1 TsaB [Solirubrobacteraceae bacterium]
MIVLSIDTSTSATTVGLALADGRVLEARDDPSPTEHPGHATRLLELVDGLLTRGDLDYSQLQRIAVGLGPGTFTGLRVGVATARGLAHSLALDLVGVSSLAALAVSALAECQQGAGGVLAVIDARRGEAFVAAYAGERQLSAPQALSPAALVDLLQELPGGPWLAVGDGALRFERELRDAGAVVPGKDSQLHLISAVALCDLALNAPIPEPRMILPEYCRRPDAEIALEGAKR